MSNPSIKYYWKPSIGPNKISLICQGFSLNQVASIIAVLRCYANGVPDALVCRDPSITPDIKEFLEAYDAARDNMELIYKPLTIKK